MCDPYTKKIFGQIICIHNSLNIMETPIPNKKKEESIQRRIAHPNVVSSYRLLPIGRLQLFFFDLTRGYRFRRPEAWGYRFCSPDQSIYYVRKLKQQVYIYVHWEPAGVFFLPFRGYENGRSRFGPTNTVKPAIGNIMCADWSHRYIYMRIGWQSGIYLHVYWTRGHIFGDCLKCGQTQHKNIRYHIFLCKLFFLKSTKKNITFFTSNMKHGFSRNMIFLMIVKNTHLCMRDFVCERHTQRCFVCYMRWAVDYYCRSGTCRCFSLRKVGATVFDLEGFGATVFVAPRFDLLNRNPWSGIGDENVDVWRWGRFGTIRI